MIGLVSDADGAIAALSIALKLADMKEQGDVLPGDVMWQPMSALMLQPSLTTLFRLWARR